MSNEVDSGEARARRRHPLPGRKYPTTGVVLQRLIETLWAKLRGIRPNGGEAQPHPVQAPSRPLETISPDPSRSSTRGGKSNQP